MKFLKHYWWFIVLLALSILLLAQRMCSKTLIDKQFSITNVEDIDDIFICNGVDSVSICKTENGWIVDNAQVADLKAVKSLFNVISRLTTESPIPSKLNDSLVGIAELKGVKVRLSSNGKPKLCFSALYLLKLNKTILVSNKSNKAYFVGLVEYSGRISDLFIPQKSYWTGNQLFNIPVSQVSRILVDNPQNPQESYIIDINGNGFELRRKSSNEILTNVDTNRIARFVSGLDNLDINKLTASQLDAAVVQIRIIEPFRLITIFSDSHSSQIKFYPIKVDITNELGINVEFDPNSFYLVYAENQIAVATYVNFSSVLWDIQDLVVKN